ncbi:MAG: FtsX-like permease family protein [Planctomycetaceae bacterium]|nr:FtsX-like permease family protein [Planctomycetaceae bacterium]
MSIDKVVWQSLRFYWRIHLAVALGVAAAAAVLTGALLVGDSVRGSLKHLTLDRLGRIDELLLVDRFFRQELASELAAQPAFGKLYDDALPAILFPAGTLERGSQRRAGGVLVVGSTSDFWKLGDAHFAATTPPGPGEITLNEPLAAELKAKVGDSVILRLGKATQVPADSPLGRKTDRIQSIPSLKVTAIVPAESLGRFSLQPMQTSPRVAFVAMATLEEGLEVAGKANAIIVAGKSDARAALQDAHEQLTALLSPRLEDYGLALKHVHRAFDKDGQSETIFDYFSLTSERMMLDEASEREAMRAFGGAAAQPVLTYLANSIENIDPAAADRKGIPYSTITAIDPAAGGPLVDMAGQPLPPLAEDEIVLTSWAAEDQLAKVGDRIRVTYFEPETTHGEEKEVSSEFRVAAIVPLAEPAKGYTRREPAVFTERPTAANDPDLTPEVKGITDQATIADWDAPFPFSYERIRDQDDTYWDHHRTTPKAYVSLAAGRKLWGSRFGQATSIRIPAADGVTAESLESRLIDQLRKDNERLGMDFQPLKAQGLAAASGTTPFDVLFLLLSMFIIAAALMLIWLLFRLGVEQRASEIGTLLALGWTRRQVAWLLLLEGCIVAAVGAAIGVLGGLGYAWLMLAGLRTWWIGAISSPFLTLYITPLSLIAGFFAGLVISALTIWFSLRGLRSVPVRMLMAGEAQVQSRGTREAGLSKVPGHGRWSLVAAAMLLAGAVGLSILATSVGGEAQAGAFLGSGALVLVAILLLIARGLRGAEGAFSSGALPTLAVRNAGRSVGRSITTIALMAAAAFLIVAVSSFRQSPSDRGVGGFDLLAESSEPIIPDLNSAAGRRDLFAGDAARLDGTTILALRVKAGDDASCQNLYQPSQPRVLGVPPAFIRHFDQPGVTRFGWAASAAKSTGQLANPWHLLEGRTPPNEPVPVVLDKNTAMYSLKLYRGVGEEFAFSYSGQEVKFRVAGLLDNSVLQGSLLVSEADFTRLFPTSSGYRMFLVRAPAGKSADIAALLESKLGDEGFDAVDSRGRLAELLAVQNTYISTFQSLGAIGLVLGTFGLAAVQLRSVFERRKELALLRASGFRRLRLGEMVLLENLLLLLGGLTAGTLAAIVTVLPHMAASGARVPLADLAVMLGVVLVVGVLTGLIAVRATLQAPLVAALRGE